MKNMVRNEDAFKQRFRTAKGVRTRFFFFFGFGAIVRPMAKKPEKIESGSVSWKRGTESLRGKNIWSVPTFLWVRTHFFFCGVNGAYETEKSWGRGCATRDVAHFAKKRKPNLCLKTYQNQQNYNQTDDNCYLMKTICCKNFFRINKPYRVTDWQMSWT